MRFNQCTIVGRVGSDQANIRQVGDSTVASFNVAVNAFKRDGKPQWFTCSLWGNRADKLGGYITKGKLLLLSGEVSLREYDDREGNHRANLELRVGEIAFLEKNQDSGGQRDTGRRQSRNDLPNDDDIPW